VCSLKCKHCSEHVPYAIDKRILPARTIVSDIRKFAAASVFIPILAIVGGEPLLNAELADILRSLKGIKNIGFISLTTNGTVLASDELIRELSDKRIVVQMSEYSTIAGKLKSNFLTNYERFSEHGVKVYRKIATTWYDNSSFEFNDDDAQILEKRFEACPMRSSCVGLHDGIYYRCVHDYAGHVTGKYDNSVDRINIGDYDDNTLCEKLDALHSRKYIECCRYCDAPFDSPVVPVAEQLSRRAASPNARRK
jgi:sulfatase maturation enzyme AslB (radical SAM superfamily)